MESPQTAVRPGGRIGPYRLGEVLGEGSFGVVYQGHHEMLRRDAAVKVLKAGAGQERFLREARALASLRHPNVVEVYDGGSTETGEVYLALELLEGETLQQRLRAGALSLEEAAWVIDGVLAALGAAHERRIIHRDVKPSNILLIESSEGVQVKLIDFGISRLLDEERLTDSGALIGTGRYFSPEIAGAESYDHRTDLWSAAIVLYESVTAQAAYRGDVWDIIPQILRGPPAGLSRLAPDLREVLEGALCAKELRYRNAVAFRDAVAHLTGFAAIASTTRSVRLIGALAPTVNAKSDLETRVNARAPKPADAALPATLEAFPATKALTDLPDSEDAPTVPARPRASAEASAGVSWRSPWLIVLLVALAFLMSAATALALLI